MRVSYGDAQTAAEMVSLGLLVADPLTTTASPTEVEVATPEIAGVSIMETNVGLAMVSKDESGYLNVIPVVDDTHIRVSVAAAIQEPRRDSIGGDDTGVVIFHHPGNQRAVAEEDAYHGLTVFHPLDGFMERFFRFHWI
ncbi:hypothetical protein BB934_01205 [Microvirga ossetica]|uniref:Uncharacterized protein n=1 Tax=Microvirga ossetica TaxID=1882682 RepID=A0A1B2EAJ9_9HYPH|nr:hypothetical protein [Microvirga ossetica]ANY77004.1 hypothetical protein BB934_01205 [Microvirga ossetica]